MMISSMTSTSPATPQNQAWVWENYQIRLAGSNDPGKCIDLPGGDAKNGNYLWLWECTGDASQKWSLDGGQIKLTSNPTFCVDLPGSDVSNGNRLWIWECNGGANQQWTTTQLKVAEQHRSSQTSTGFTGGGELLQASQTSNATADETANNRSRGGRPQSRSQSWFADVFRRMREERRSQGVRQSAGRAWHEGYASQWYANQSRRARMPMPQASQRQQQWTLANQSRARMTAAGRAAEAFATERRSPTDPVQVPRSPARGAIAPTTSSGSKLADALPALRGGAGSVPRTIALRKAPGIFCLDMPGAVGQNPFVQVWECNGECANRVRALRT